MWGQWPAKGPGAVRSPGFPPGAWARGREGREEFQPWALASHIPGVAARGVADPSRTSSFPRGCPAAASLKDGGPSGQAGRGTGAKALKGLPKPSCRPGFLKPTGVGHTCAVGHVHVRVCARACV